MHEKISVGNTAAQIKNSLTTVCPESRGQQYFVCNFYNNSDKLHTMTGEKYRLKMTEI